MTGKTLILCERTFLTVLLMLLCVSSIGKNYYFRHYDKSDGLAHQTVYSAVQDANGFLWFGTKSGLSRFDGSVFKNYIDDTDRLSTLSGNAVNALAVSADGTLWIGTTEGLFLYNPVRDTFSEFRCDEFSIDGHVEALATDKQGDLWVLTGKCVFVIDLNGGPNRQFNIADAFYPSGILVSQSGRIWILGSDGRIHLFDSQKGIIHSYPVLTEEERRMRVSLYRILECSNGDLLVTTNNVGVRRFSPNTGEVSTLFTADRAGRPIYIHCAIQSGEDEFWFGTETGVHIYKIGTGFTANLTKSYEDPYSLSDNAIHMLMKDREGGIWVGSFFGGLNYLSSDNTLFEKYLPSGTSGHVQANVIREIQPGPDGLLYVGTEDGGLCTFQPATEAFRKLESLQWNGQPISRNIQGLMLEGSRNLWIGTFDQGIYIYDLVSRRILHHYGADDPSSGLPSGIVCIRQVSSGDILVGTTGGLYLLGPDRKKYARLPINGLIHSIFEDHEKVLWIGTLGNGVFRMAVSTLRQHPDPQSVPLPTPFITSIHEDSKDNIWIGTEGMGLIRYDRRSAAAHPVLDEEEFPGIIVYQIVEDAMGTFWLTTSDGLLQYAPSEGVTRRFSTANGLPIDQFNYNSSYQSRTGTIYLGTLRGMISFSPENLRSESAVPQVFLTGLWLFDKEIKAYQPHSTLSESILYTRKISLAHDQNTLSLSFASPTFSISQNTWYRYMMQGLENEWNIAREPSRISYTKLPPGHYTFHVQASSVRGVWDGETSSLSITIRPPFWKTRWAYALYVLGMTVLLLYVFLSSRNAVRRKAQNQLERLNDEKQKEILQAKINFFTNITHEIRTPLTLIMGSLDRVRNAPPRAPADNQNLQIMTKNAQRLLDLVNQLLDFRKIESSSFLMDYVHLNLSRLVKDIYMRFTPLAQVKGVEFELHFFKENYEITADKEALTKIVSNMLSNALKFCSGKVTVSLSDAENHGTGVVRLRVDNDGARIPDKEAAEIFKPFYQYSHDGDVGISHGSGLGLPLSRSLAEMMGGAFYLDTSEKDVNSFVLEMPLDPGEVHIPESKEVLSQEGTAMQDPLTFEKKQGPCILVVDDELDVRKFISEELSSRDYKVLQAGDGKEALDILENHTVSLIISDLMMPVMDGVSFCKSVKSNIKFSHIPVIILTAKVSMQAHIESLEAKADAYIEKPFSTEHLLTQVSNLLSNRELIRSNFVSSPYAHLSTVASNATDEKFLRKMNDYVMANLSDPSLSVESLADYMSMSLSTLYRKVKSITSLSPSDFIRLCRLKKAAELLSRGDMRISEVAEHLGFANSSYFTTSFMKQFGVTPSEFVKMAQR